jgi:predicted nucleic acid-binding protein
LIVLDSSAALEYLLGTKDGAPWVEAQCEAAGWRLHAPHVIDIEVIGVLRKGVLRRGIPVSRARTALDVLANLPLTRYPHVQLLDRAWNLRAHIASPDAFFVALAEALGAPLVTTDLRLSRAHGIRAMIVAP